MEKKCFKCKLFKDLEDFYPHPRMKDGHLNKCKECNKKDTNNRYYKDFDKIQKYEKEREQTDHRKQKKLEYQRKRRALNPEKNKARQIVSNAIRYGKLKKQPCEICGEKAQAHHEDYSKPLEIKWLCFKHHRESHGQLDSNINRKNL